MKYLYSKIMGTDNDLVMIPFLTLEELNILSNNDVSYEKAENGYLVNASQAKAIFCH